MRVFPEALVEVLVQADFLQRKAAGVRLSHYPRWRRVWVEPFFNLLGLLFGQGMQLLPWRLRRPLDLWFLRHLSHHAPAPNRELTDRTEQSLALAQRLKSQTDAWPAVLLFAAHPPTVGPLEWLRFEVLRQAMELADSLVEAAKPSRAYRQHPQCLLGIDPYALDTLSMPAAGFYQGWMHRIYLAWDRQSAGQSWLQSHVLLRGTGYARIADRLLRRLKGGIPVLMALGGGLPQNARLLYASREFVKRLRVRRWPYPRTAVAQKLMYLLMEREAGVWPCATGEIPEATLQRVGALLRELGLDAGQIEPALQGFREEFRQPVPYRERLWRFLLRRLVRAGQPLLWIAVAYREEAPFIRISEPWGCVWDSAKGFQWFRGATAPAQTLSDIASLAQPFSRLF
jgi:hypothetical protein